jgi:pyrimidine nucleoside transport protein
VIAVSWFVQYSLAKVFVPVAWLMGVEPSQCQNVAKLIGIKTTVNEFIAYKELGVMKRQRLLSVSATFNTFMEQ